MRRSVDVRVAGGARVTRPLPPARPVVPPRRVRSPRGSQGARARGCEEPTGVLHGARGHPAGGCPRQAVHRVEAQELEGPRGAPAHVRAGLHVHQPHRRGGPERQDDAAAGVERAGGQRGGGARSSRRRDVRHGADRRPVHSRHARQAHHPPRATARDPGQARGHVLGGAAGTEGARARRSRVEFAAWVSTVAVIRGQRRRRAPVRPRSRRDGFNLPRPYRPRFTVRDDKAHVHVVHRQRRRAWGPRVVQDG